MARVCLLLLVVFFTAAVKANSLEDEMATLENDLKNIEEKRQAKKSINDVEASELLAELKKEVLNAADHADLKIRFNDILKKKESEIVAEENNVLQKSVNDAAEKQDADLGKLLKDDVKKETSDDEFFKKLDSKADDMKDDPEAKRALDLMADDLLTKEINAVSDAVQKRAGECADKRNDCEALKKNGYCVSHSENMRKVCPKTCDLCKCVDKISHCKFLADRGRCGSDKRMAGYCPKSCGFCKVPSPPKCSKTALGCCWDKVTPKLNKAGKNCPDCKDQYRYVCKTFQDDCGKFNVAGDFMLKHCVKTCGLCDKGCKDDVKMSFYCGFWKKDLNWCTAKKDMMIHYCPVTCGFC